MELYTVVHPIGPGDVAEHPAGWRWAIHTDDRFYQTESGCLNAGFEFDQSAAENVLSMVLITARRALTAAGVTSTVVSQVLADCVLTREIYDVLAQLA